MIQMVKWNSRDGFIEEIKTAGQYVIDHADNLLGEYPSLLTGELVITLRFDMEALPTVKVEREYLSVTKDEYDRWTRLRKGGDASEMLVVPEENVLD